jgi:hypothetical protein
MVIEENSGIYRGQWSWQSEMPALLYEMMHTGKADAVSPSGFTALQAACVYADESLFHALLERGAAVDPRPIDWQTLGYVGDTPLGLLVRFMNARTAAARVRMARVLLERGADPDARMTTWKGNRVVSSTPFCELGKERFNHDMRMLLLQYGEQNLQKRTAGWSLDWDCFEPELVQRLRSAGVVKSGEVVHTAETTRKTVVGTIPLLDLIRKGDVEGVRLALDAGASIEVSPRARRYGQEPLFNIPARKKDCPEAAVEIARMLIEAGADVNALNRHGSSLRIHYDRYYSKASRALCAYFKSCGSLIHPDSPDKKAEVEQTRLLAQQRAEARAARLAGYTSPEVAAEPAPEAEPEPQQPVVEEPAPVAQPEPQQPVVEEPAPVAEPEPQQPAVEEPAPKAEPEPQQPAVEEPAPEAEPEPQQPAVEEPAPVAEHEQQQPAVEEPAPVAEPEPQQPAVEEPTVDKAQEASARLLLEVQSQLAELQTRYELELQEKEKAQQQMPQEEPSTTSPE